MDGDFRTEFTRSPAGLKHRPALVLNADYRPLSYYPLSLWPWQEAIKAKWLDRVDIVAEYDDYVHSPSMQIKIPSVVVLKDYVKPQKRVAFTRFNLFLRDEFRCQYCGARGDLTFDHVVPRAAGGVTSWQNVVAACSPCNLKPGFICANHHGNPKRRNCATWGANFRQTICTKVGWIFCTGTPSFKPDQRFLEGALRVD